MDYAFLSICIECTLFICHNQNAANISVGSDREIALVATNKHNGMSKRASERTCTIEYGHKCTLHIHVFAN